MKKMGLIVVSAALIAGCSASPSAAPASSAPATSAAPKELTSEQISTLQDELRKVDRTAVNGSLDKARAVCAQIADGAHGEGFVRGIALRFGVDQSKGQALLDVIKAAEVC